MVKVKKLFRINLYLFLSFVFLHILDLGLTNVGVNQLGYQEGNCLFKEQVEDNNYLRIIIYKIFFLGGLGFVLYKFKKDKVIQYVLAPILFLAVLHILYFQLSWIRLIYIATI